MAIENTRSTVIITESCDLESASDFIARSFQADDLHRIRSIIVQVSIQEKFIQLLKSKLRSINTESEKKVDINRLQAKVKEFTDKSFEVIWNHSETVPGIIPLIVQCPSNYIENDDLPIISLEFFRTTKEGISFAKAAPSVSLWCENISVAFEWINSLPIARQIWLNAAHGVIHPKIPFYNGDIVCEDTETLEKVTVGGSSTSEVFQNVHFLTTFKGKGEFQTVAIPFGETFAN